MTKVIHSDELLLDAARSVFSASGFEAASMDAIAAAAGATKPTLYGRFGSKSELYERAVRRDADALVEHLFAAYQTAAAQPVGAMVEASMAAYFGFFEQHPDAFGLLFASGRSEPAELLAEQVLDAVTDRLTQMVNAVLARQHRSAPQGARLLAAMLLGIAHHGVTQIRRDPTLNTDLARALATALALSGLRELPQHALAPPRRREP